MSTENNQAQSPLHTVGPELKHEIDVVSTTCIRCDLCQKECAFLRRYGKPKDIADRYDPEDATDQRMPFECSLCGLCTAVCPVRVDPARMLLAMRTESVSRGQGRFSRHDAVLRFEQRGASPQYSSRSLPQGCDTVLFPGCNMPGSRPRVTWALFEHMRRFHPSMGMVLDCCAKPSHDLGRTDRFAALFGELRQWLLGNGVRTVVVCCPNCYKVFETHGDGLEVMTVYEFLVRHGLPGDHDRTLPLKATVTLHDPCPLRLAPHVQEAVRDIIGRLGLSLEEMEHCRDRTLCCGEGGSVGFLDRELAETWGKIRRQEARGKVMVSYCAGCVSHLKKYVFSVHLLDLIFDPARALSGRARIALPPFTSLNRLLLKRRLGKLPAAVRAARPGKDAKN